MEPLDGLLGRRVGTDAFLAGDEIEDVAAMTTLPETVPEVLADADPELGGVRSLVKGTTTAEAVAAPFHRFEDAVMFEDTLHRNGLPNRTEIDQLIFGHDASG
jgi:hypothetical protein